MSKTKQEIQKENQMLRAQLTKLKFSTPDNSSAQQATTKEAKYCNVAKFHLNEKGNYALRYNDDGMIPREVFGKLIDGTFEERILKSAMIDGRRRSWVKGVDFPRLEEVLKGANIKIELVD